MNVAIGVARVFWMFLMLAAHALDALLWFLRSLARVVDVVYRLVVIAFLLLLIYLALTFLGIVRLAHAQDGAPPTPTPAATPEANVAALLDQAADNYDAAQAYYTQAAQAEQNAAGWLQQAAAFTQQAEERRRDGALQEAEAAISLAREAQRKAEEAQAEYAHHLALFAEKIQQADVALRRANQALGSMEAISAELDERRDEVVALQASLSARASENASLRNMIWERDERTRWLTGALIMVALFGIVSILYQSIRLSRKLPVTVREMQPVHIWPDGGVYDRPPDGVGWPDQPGQSRPGDVLILNPDFAMDAVRELDRDFGKSS